MGTARCARPGDRLRAPLERADGDRGPEVHALAGRGLGTQPCRGIARWKLIEDDERGTASTAVLPSFTDFDRFPHALKIPAPKGRNIVAYRKRGDSPFHAEPRHCNQCGKPALVTLGAIRSVWTAI